LFDAVLVMMIVIFSIFIMTALFTWRYRGANRNAPYTPNFAYYWPVEILIWCVPAAIIGWLSHHLWGSTHRLDPYKPIDTGVKPHRSKVVGQFEGACGACPWPGVWACHPPISSGRQGL